MSFIYAMADTWNAIGTTFNSILMNVSNGSGGAPVGAAASRILNLQANGLSVFNVDVAGITQISSNATVSIPTINATGTIFSAVAADGAASRLVLQSFGSAVSAFNTVKANGTAALPTAITAALNIGQFGAVGYGTTGYSTATRGSFNILGAETWTDTANGVSCNISVVRKTTTTNTKSVTFDSEGSVYVNNNALATTATDGFLHIPTCAGQPTGVPTLVAGLIPMIYDTTNHQFWFYDSGWKQPKTPAGAAIVTWQ